MTIERYIEDKEQEWNDFIGASRNSTFLFLRDYMDYHKDRFTDHSLMYRNDKGKLLAVMPANEKDGVLHSHQGLTFGGIILSNDAHAVDVRDVFDITKAYLQEHHISEWHYSPVPTIYHRIPSQEDEYWLWRNGAQLDACKISTTIDLKAEDISSNRKRSYQKRLQREGYIYDKGCDIEDFWPILEENLMLAHNVKPVHTLEEIKRLQKSLPENILCVGVRNAEGQLEAGTVLYVSGQVVHTQYISATSTGKQTKAMDMLMLSLIDDYRRKDNFRFLDFGNSNEQGGWFLNESLIRQKEGFGGRGTVYKSYVIK